MSTNSSCPICFDDLNDKIKASPDICDHVFCLLCIEKWSKLGSYCPVDRKRYKKIVNLESEDVIQVKPRKRKKRRVVYDFTTTCEICSSDDSPDTLLLCDCCDLGFHCLCLSPPLTAIPAGLWFCPTCVEIEEKLRNRKGLKKGGDDFCKTATLEEAETESADPENFESSNYNNTSSSEYGNLPGSKSQEDSSKGKRYENIDIKQLTFLKTSVVVKRISIDDFCISSCKSGSSREDSPNSSGEYENNSMPVLQPYYAYQKWDDNKTISKSVLKKYCNGYQNANKSNNTSFSGSNTANDFSNSRSEKIYNNIKYCRVCNDYMNFRINDLLCRICKRTFSKNNLILGPGQSSSSKYLKNVNKSDVKSETLVKGEAGSSDAQSSSRHRNEESESDTSKKLFYYSDLKNLVIRQDGTFYLDCPL